MKTIKIQSINVCFYLIKNSREKKQIPESRNPLFLPCKNYYLFFFPYLANSVNNLHSKSITSSEQSPYNWTEDNDDSQKSSKEYNGRMISQSTISKSKYH
jgi:hypothetical protein